jgi:hypothetical protein
MNQVGFTMIYSRAGKKPVSFIPGPVYTGSVLIEVKPGHIPTSTHYCFPHSRGEGDCFVLKP